MKSEKYDELQNRYLDGEISEEELEEEMDTLFESGDDFLSQEEPEHSGPSMVREVGEFVAFFSVIAVVMYVIAVTKGMALPLLVPVGVAYVMYKMGVFN